MGKFGLSATEIGSRIGASAMEVNRLLKEQGFVYGEPGAYGLTSKGEEFGVQRPHDNGYGGFAHRSWETTHFDPSIMDVLDSSHERLAKVRADISADRRERQAARKIAQDEADQKFRASVADKEAAQGQGQRLVDPEVLLLIAAGLIVATASGAILGVRKGVAWYKRKKAEKAENSAQVETGSDTSIDDHQSFS